MKRILVLSVGALLLMGVASADQDFTIQDGGGNPLLRVDGDTGDVNITEGDLNLSQNSLVGANIDGNQVNDNAIDNSDIQNGDRFTFNGIDTNANIDANDNSIDDVASIDGGGDAVSVDNNIDLTGSNLVVGSGGDIIGPNGNTQLEFEPGGIELQSNPSLVFGDGPPSSGLDMQGFNIKDSSGSLTLSSNTDVNGDLQVDTIDTGNGNFEIGQNLRTTDTVTFEDITVSEDSFDLGQEDLVDIDANAGLGGGGTNGLTDPVDLSVNTGNAITVNSDNVEVAGNTIDDEELVNNGIDAGDIGQNAVTSSGNELDSSVAGSGVSLGSGSLDLNAGDDLSVDGNDNLDLQSSVDLGRIDFANEESASNNDGAIAFDSSEGLMIYRTQQPGDVSGNNDYMLLDRANIQGGNALSITGGQGDGSAPVSFSVGSGTINSDEISSGAITNTEIDNGGSFTFSGITSSSNINLFDNSVSFSDTSITEQSGNHLLLQGRDPDQQLRLTDGGSMVYEEYNGGGNAFEVDSTGGADDAAVRLGQSGGNVPLDMNNNDINEIGGLQNCGTNEFVDGNGNCQDAGAAKTTARFTSTDTTTDINKNSWTIIPWDVQLDISSGYTHDPSGSPGQVTFDESGTYKVHTMLTYSDSNSRTNPGIKFSINGNRRDRVGLSGYTRNREGHDEASNYLTEMVDVQAGDTLRVEAKQFASGGTSTLINRASVLVVQKVSETVPKSSDVDKVDGSDAADFVNKAGDTMSGDINMNDNNLDDVASVDGGNNDIQVNDPLQLNNNRIKTDTNGNYIEGSTASFSNINSGSGGEIDIQDQINFNSVNMKNIQFEDANDLDRDGNTNLEFTNINDAGSDETVTSVDNVRVDEGAGLRLESPNSDTATLSMGSHWKEIYVDGTEELVPSGQEPLNLATNNELSITADSTASPQKLSFNVNAGNVLAKGSDLDSNGDVSSLTDVNTDDLSEGTNNQYFTDERGEDAAWDIASGGSNVDVNYDDGADSATISLSGSLYSDEDSQDAVGNIMNGTGATSVTYTDDGGAGAISIDTPQQNDLVAGDGLSGTANNILPGGSDTDATLSVNPANFAGTFLSNDNNNDLQVSTGTFISGDGSGNIDVDISNGLQNDGSGNIAVDWSDASDLDQNGNLASFEDANDLDSSGDVSDNSVQNAELDLTNGLTVAGGAAGDGTQSGFEIDGNGNVFLSGSLNLPGDINTVNAQEIDGSVIPETDATLNLGNQSNRYSDLYLADNIYDTSSNDPFFDGGCSEDQYITGITSTGQIQCSNEPDNTNSINGDLVAGNGLSGGSDDVLPGGDSDVTLDLDANDLDSAGNVSSLSEVTTDDLSEGSNNEYHTDGRVHGAVESGNVDNVQFSNIENVGNGQIGRDNSIGYLAEWAGQGTAVLWDAYNVQTNGGISISGGKGQESNPKINLAANDLDSNGNLQSDTVADNEISNNTVDNSEIQNSNRFAFSGVDLTSSLNAQDNRINGVSDLKFDAAGTPSLETDSGSGGDDAINVYDSANNNVITKFNEGGPVEIQNANLNLNGNSLDNIGDLGQCSNSQSVYLDGAGNCQDLSANTGSYINGDLLTDSVDGSEIEAQSIAGDDLGGDDDTINLASNIDVNRISGLGGGSASINGGDIRLQPDSAGGTASISFESNTNAGSDGGWLAWYDDNDNYNFYGDTSENGALVLGTTNDNRNSNSDVTVLKSPAAAVIDAPELNLNGNSIANIGGLQDCGSNEFVNGNGNCETDTDKPGSDDFGNANDLDSNGNLQSGAVENNEISDNSVGNSEIDNSDVFDLNNKLEVTDGGKAELTADNAQFGVAPKNSELDGSQVVYAGGNVDVEGDFRGSGGDLAEKVNSSDKLKKGEVAVIAGNMSLEQSSEAYDTAVAGVVSTDPGIVLAKNRDGKNLGLSGIVPVKVTTDNGKINSGDLLTPSAKPGKAMKCRDEDKCENAVIGKAMQPTDTDGKVRVLLTMG